MFWFWFFVGVLLVLLFSYPKVIGYLIFGTVVSGICFALSPALGGISVIVLTLCGIGCFDD